MDLTSTERAILRDITGIGPSYTPPRREGKKPRVRKAGEVCANLAIMHAIYGVDAIDSIVARGLAEVWRLDRPLLAITPLAASLLHAVIEEQFGAKGTENMDRPKWVQGYTAENDVELRVARRTSAPRMPSDDAELWIFGGEVRTAIHLPENERTYPDPFPELISADSRLAHRSGDTREAKKTRRDRRRERAAA